MHEMAADSRLIRTPSQIRCSGMRPALEEAKTGHPDFGRVRGGNMTHSAAPAIEPSNRAMTPPRPAGDERGTI
jgi:hypothetical protein